MNAAVAALLTKVGKKLGKKAWEERYAIWKHCPGIGLRASAERERLRQLRQVEPEGGRTVEPRVDGELGNKLRDGGSLKHIPSILLAAVLLSGCAMFKSDSGTKIIAPHSADVLYGALHAAEAQLGQTYDGGKIRVRFEEGDVRTGYGWKGKRVSGGVLGGQTSSIGNTTLYLTDGKIHPHNAEHEMAHQILFSHGIPASQHHEIMKAAGFRW